MKTKTSHKGKKLQSHPTKMKVEVVNILKLMAPGLHDKI